MNIGGEEKQSGAWEHFNEEEQAKVMEGTVREIEREQQPRGNGVYKAQ